MIIEALLLHDYHLRPLPRYQQRVVFPLDLRQLSRQHIFVHAES